MITEAGSAISLSFSTDVKESIMKIFTENFLTTSYVVKTAKY